MWRGHCLCRGDLSVCRDGVAQRSGTPAAALPCSQLPLVVGLLDDRRNLPATWRYGVQLLTAAVVLGLSPLVQSVGLPVASGSCFFCLPYVFLIAVTAVINFLFMDGLDGLVADAWQ